MEARRDISPANRVVLGRMFGKLELRYTPTKCYSTFAGQTDVFRYRIIATDTDSVAITLWSDEDSPVIEHIRFEKALYWICLGAFREYFRRMPEPRATAARRRTS